ncbi:E3 ubiquitin-protein ligase RHF2A [Camellia lanceoleosa]|uniref:E3 ubiquitin-protein ligase RHF2A n=1 Tax=Camellia lanceoleosa TaxID=1840588 RepID=A0ACC0FSG2_9ERIC|nr:E3 ubiquitin-protein ligase RHF2A [Camellia lanceoleosa]
MEVPGMDEINKTESHLTSAAAFVEGGIQESCDDACSICLEAFIESDPSTVTTCKHEFHLQCILEWCQRSSNCPMCWQSISLKDPSSQELLEGVERERSFRFNPSRNSTIFHHPTLGDFELQHLPVGANDAELEERIIQHLAAAAAMGRSHHHIARRDGPRSRSSVHGRPQFVVLSSHPNSPPAYLAPVGGESEPATITVASPSVPLAGGDEPQQHRHQFHSVQTDQFSSSSSGSTMIPGNRRGISVHNRFLKHFFSCGQTSLPNQDRAGPSDLQSFSESVKSRFNSMSMRYKETISKGTRGWRERLFSRSNTSMADIGSEVRREVNAGIASVSRLMERLENRENSSADHASASHNLAGPSVTEQLNQNNVETRHATSRNDSSTAAIAASSVSN